MDPAEDVAWDVDPAERFALDVDDKLIAKGLPRQQTRRDMLLNLFLKHKLVPESISTLLDVQSAIARIEGDGDRRLSNYKHTLKILKDILREHCCGEEKTPEVRKAENVKWEKWQVGEEQLSLPDTEPGSDHHGINFACYRCGNKIIDAEEIHRLKHGALWSNCKPRTVQIGKENYDEAKSCSFFQVDCGFCGDQNLGSFYEATYGIVTNQMFPCVKFIITFQKEKQMLNRLVLVGQQSDVESCCRELKTTLAYNKSEEYGKVRSCRSEEIRILKLRNAELERKVAELKQKLEVERGQHEEAQKALEQLQRMIKELDGKVLSIQDTMNRQQEEIKSEYEQKVHNYKRELEEGRREDKRKLEVSIEEERRRIEEDERRLLMEKEQLEADKRSFKDKTECPIEKVNRFLGSRRKCQEYIVAEMALTSLSIPEVLFNRMYDRCYCRSCYQPSFPNTIHNHGPEAYVVPRGWVRFGLQVPIQAHINDVWNTWCVSFHGTRHDVAKAILKTGDFLLPGDTLPDQTVLKSSKCAGRTDNCVYSSPTVNYAGLAFYAQPSECGGRMFQVVLQCRQEPGTFEVQAETMGFKRKGHLDLCPLVPWQKIEWKTKIRKSVMFYGILIRTFLPGELPPYIKSPVDPQAWYRL